MLTCEFCAEVYDSIDEIDHTKEGFWCDMCDSFTYYKDERKAQDRFTLILEDKNVPQSSVVRLKKFKKNLSPLRYPGGKSRMVDYLYSFLQEKKSVTLYSPFTGGGSFELAMLIHGVVDKLVLNDIDYGIFSLWWVILNMPDELIARIHTITPTHKDYFGAQHHIKRNYIGLDMIDAAWATLLVNRLAYSGISKANPLGGKNGSRAALLSRWNPAELVKRIQRISNYSDRIDITCEEAYSFIEESYWDNNGSLFIDPPYVEKGQALYNHAYTIDEHKDLAFLLDELYKGMPGADVLITYDYNRIINDAYEHPTIELVGRKYSI